jgi:Recombinase-like helix-turn-helix domain
MSETGMIRTHVPSASASDVVADFNRYIAPYRNPQPNQSAGAGQIFEGAARELIVWQTRPAMPTEYEEMLASALEQIFAQRTYELPDIVAALNRDGIRTPGGEAWTEANFESTFRELGKLAFG